MYAINLMNKQMNANTLPASTRGYWPWNIEEKSLKESVSSKTTYAKISIITPSYNQGEYLEETIRSILLQNYPNLEFIVIDGGSKDNSIDIIKKYEPWLTYWVSEADKGQSDAINKGLRRATGDIITWINSDDLLTPNALLEVNRYFNSLNESVGVIYGITQLFDETGNLNTDGGYKEQSIERYISGMAFPQPSSFFRKKYLDQIGNQLDQQLHYGMDYDLFARLALVCEFEKVSNIFSKYRLHNASKSVAESDQFIEDWILIFLRVVNELDLAWIKKELSEIEIFTQYKIPNATISYPTRTNFEINQPLTLFYFLSYVLKGKYWNGEFKDAKIIQNYIKENFERSKIYREKDLQRPFQRLLNYPIWLLSLQRRLRKFF